VSGGSRPLEGIRVVELAGIGPGPFACGLLADLGADVVRVERPKGADGQRSGLPGGLGGIGVRDRVIVEVDVKDASGLDTVRTMVTHADVLVEGYRPGVAERLGLGPLEAHAINPRLVYARITGWGQSGPLAGMAGHDINYIGLSGVLAAIGLDEPMPPLNLVGDYGGGAMFAVVGILAGIVERDRTGLGTVVDAAMIDGSGALLGPIRDLLNLGMWSERRSTNLLDGGAPFYRTYRTADDRFVAVGALEAPFYEAFLSGLGIDSGSIPDRMDPASWHELGVIFAEAFSARTRDEWALVFDGTDACVTPVLTMSEVMNHAHNSERTAIVETPTGPRPNVAPRFGDPVPAVRPAASRDSGDTLASLGLSEETRSVLGEAGRIRVV
jgi:alpha-methylacyl-CoA racemase